MTSDSRLPGSQPRRSWPFRLHQTVYSALMLGGLFVGSGSAFAQQSPASTEAVPAVGAAGDERVVTLRDGSFFRGVVVEQAVNDYLVLRLGVGAFRRIAWAEIASSAPVTSASTPPVPAQPAGSPVPSPSAPGSVRVTIETNRPGVRLYREKDGGEMRVGWGVVSFGTWVPACDSPCGAVLDRSSRFRIQGEEITSSDEFNLVPSGAVVRLAVQAGSRSKRRTGVALSAVGGSLIGIGLVSLGIGGLNAGLDTTGGQTDSRNYFIAGGVATGIGMPLLIGGLVLIIGNRTTVVVDP